MKFHIKKVLSTVLCAALLIGCITNGIHLHFGSHGDDGHDHETVSIGAICNDAVELLLSFVAAPVNAGYEDGVYCDHCGEWRYDDWKCDNGDHCGEGSGTSCYEEHHCGYCGACDDDHELCDDCGNCLEDHCECEDKCRGCYEMGETVCKECGEKCSGCAEWICDD